MAKAKYTKDSRGYFHTKVWDGTYNKDGSKHLVNLRSKKSSADLERMVNDMKNDIENGGYSAPSSYTFVEYAYIWLESKKSVKEKNTQAMYRNVIDRHLQPLAGVPLKDMTNDMFQLCINDAADKPRTCQQIYLTVKQIVKNAAANGLLSERQVKMIVSDISLPKYQKPLKRALDDSERDALFKADFTAREKAFVFMLYYTGMRRGEALALTVFDIDWKNSTISVNKALIYDKNDAEIKPYPKSDNGIRKIPIQNDFKPILKEYVEQLSGTQLFTLVGSESLITQSSYTKLWKSIIKKMNTAAGGSEKIQIINGLTAHIFRHNFCTMMCYQIPTVSTKKIAQILGDNEKMVLEVYSHICEEKENAIEAMNNAFKKMYI